MLFCDIIQRMISQERNTLISVRSSVLKETRHSAQYYWDSSKRGKAPFVILQHTFKGEGAFSHGGSSQKVTSGTAFLSIIPEQATYFYPPEAKQPWTFSWVDFYGELSVALWQAFRERFGAVFPLPL